MAKISKNTFGNFVHTFKLIHSAIITEISDGNMAYHAGDTSQTTQNRQKILETFNITDKKLYFPNQTHSSDVISVSLSSEACNGDAVITNNKEIALGVVVADCVPIVLKDKAKGIIATIHAGWRGTANDIVTKTIHKMQKEFSSKPQDIFAGIGPSIKKCCYEVGEDTALQLGFEAKRQKIDLQEINKIRLIKAGIKSIEMLEFCTCCDNRFFSYRQDNSCGRIAAIIWQN